MTKQRNRSKSALIRRRKKQGYVYRQGRFLKMLSWRIECHAGGRADLLAARKAVPS